MDSINQKAEVVKKLRSEFGGVEFVTGVVSPMRPLSTYPPHVAEILTMGGKAPFIFIDGKIVVENRFPEFAEICQIINDKNR